MRRLLAATFAALSLAQGPAAAQGAVHPTPGQPSRPRIGADAAGGLGPVKLAPDAAEAERTEAKPVPSLPVRGPTAGAPVSAAPASAPMPPGSSRAAAIWIGPDGTVGFRCADGESTRACFEAASPFLERLARDLPRSRREASDRSGAQRVTPPAGSSPKDPAQPPAQSPPRDPR